MFARRPSRRISRRVSRRVSGSNWIRAIHSIRSMHSVRSIRSMRSSELSGEPAGMSDEPPLTSGRVQEVGTFQELTSSESSKLSQMMREQTLLCPNSKSLTTLFASLRVKVRRLSSERVGRRFLDLHSPSHIKLTQKKRKRGRFNIGVCSVYAKAVGIWLGICLLLSFIGVEVLRVRLALFIAEWSGASDPALHNLELQNMTIIGQGTWHLFHKTQATPLLQIISKTLLHLYSRRDLRQK